MGFFKTQQMRKCNRRCAAILSLAIAASMFMNVPMQAEAANASVSMGETSQLSKELLADISFDGSSEDVGSVTTSGSVTYGTGVYGNAAYFNGSASNYLKVLGESGKNDILVGRDAATISFFSKCESSIWPFYAAPSSNAQTYQSENYIGILDKASTTQFERYCNGRLNNTSSVSSKVSYTSGEWKHVVLVIEDSVTKMYINGSLVSEVASNSTLSDLFTNESYIYLGRANWGSGESYKGYIDEFKIFSWALSDIEIAELSSYYDVDSAYDFYDTMFSVKNTGNGKYVAYDGGVKANAATAEKASVQVVRYGDTGTSDSTDNIPVALQAGSNLYYFTLSGNASAGTALTAQKSLKTDKTQQFVLKKSSNWSENYMAYKIYHPLSGMYVGYTNSGSYALSAYGTSAPSYDFVFEKKGYSIVGQLKALPGYALLSAVEQDRIQDIASGVGSYSFFRYGGTTDWAFGFSMNLQVQKIVDNKGATTADEQAAAIRAVMDNYIYHGQSNYYGLPKLPGADAIQVSLGTPTYGNYNFWRGTYLNGNLYTLTITDKYGTQTIDYYVEDQGTAITNGNSMLEALKQIPYPLRRNIRTIKIRNDGANSYNCGANDLYMRLNWCPSVDNIAQYIVHEFGHSLDYTYGVSSGGSWTTAMNNDIVSISSYGDSNSYEDFAEFGRMYFQSYGNANAAYGLRQMFPNRYAKYVEILKAAGYEDILAEGYGN